MESWKHLFNSRKALSDPRWSLGRFEFDGAPVLEGNRCRFPGAGAVFNSANTAALRVLCCSGKQLTKLIKTIVDRFLPALAVASLAIVLGPTSAKSQETPVLRDRRFSRGCDARRYVDTGYSRIHYVHVRIHGTSQRGRRHCGSICKLSQVYGPRAGTSGARPFASGYNDRV